MIVDKHDKLIRRLEKLNTKDCLWIYILSMLKNKPSHAYTLRRSIEKRFGFLPGNVTAYRVLYHLTSQGFVKMNMEGRRKIYFLTPAGRAELNKAVQFYKKQFEKLR